MIILGRQKSRTKEGSRKKTRTESISLKETEVKVANPVPIQMIADPRQENIHQNHKVMIKCLFVM